MAEQPPYAEEAMATAEADYYQEHGLSPGCAGEVHEAWQAAWWAGLWWVAEFIEHEANRDAAVPASAWTWLAVYLRQKAPSKPGSETVRVEGELL